MFVPELEKDPLATKTRHGRGYVSFQEGWRQPEESEVSWTKIRREMKESARRGM